MYVTAASGVVVEVLRVTVTNANNETNEQLECVLQRVSSLGTPTKTDVTPGKHEAGDQAAASAVAANVTASEPTYASNTELGGEAFPSTAGWAFVPTPEERPTVADGATMGLRMISTPTSFDAVINWTFREIG